MKPKEELSNEMVRWGFRNDKFIAQDSYQNEDTTESLDEISTDDFSWAWESEK